MPIIDFLKKFCEATREKQLQNILDKLPDDERKEQYFYDYISDKLKLLSAMKEQQDFLFDDDRNLKVNVQEMEKFDNILDGNYLKIIPNPMENVKYWDCTYDRDFTAYVSTNFLIRSVSFWWKMFPRYAILKIYQRNNPYDDIWELILTKNYYSERHKLLHLNFDGVQYLKFTLTGSSALITNGWFYFSTFFFRNSNEPYGIDWDNEIYIAPSKNAVYNKIESMPQRVYSGAYTGDGTNNKPIGIIFGVISMIFIIKSGEGSQSFIKTPEIPSKNAKKWTDAMYNSPAIEIYNEGTSFKISGVCNENGDSYRYIVYCGE